MKLLKLEIGNIPKEKQFRSLYAGFKIGFHSLDDMESMKSFTPFCFAGLNGSGKSNVLEALSVIFFHLECCVSKFKPKSFAAHFRPHECTIDAFKLEYLIWRKGEKDYSVNNFYKITIVKDLGLPPKLFRQSFPFSKKENVIEESINPPKERRNAKSEAAPAKIYLPEIIVGYSSGENEILSIPFRKSRLMNFDKYRQDSIDARPFEEPENSLIYIDAEMSQAVLLSCLLFENNETLKPLTDELKIVGLQSFRININNYELHKLPNTRSSIGIINHCKTFIEKLKYCATCWNEVQLDIIYQDNTQASQLVLDFMVDDHTKKAFKKYFKNSFELFRFFQTLYELNLITIDEDDKDDIHYSTGVYTDWKIPESKPKSEVFTFLDYFILKKIDGELKPKPLLLREFSDGEHQFLHTIGICLMLKDRRSILLLDEPETHFNPSWRAKFVKVLNDSIEAGNKENNFNVHLLKDVLLTSHSPFIISDCIPDNVILFNKDEKGNISCSTAKKNNFNTYGTSVDLILQTIFNMPYSISTQALEEIRELLKSNDSRKILLESTKFGESYEKGFLFERIEELKSLKKL